MEAAATKSCSRCEKVLLATAEFFGPHKNGRYGLHSWCRECVRCESRERRARNPEAGRLYYRSHRESILPRQAAYAAARRVGPQRALVLERERRYREANSEKVKRWSDQYRIPRQDEINARQRRKIATDPQYRSERYAAIEAWRRANREKARCYVRNRRAALSASSGQHTKADIDHLWVRQNVKCAYCHCSLERYHVDHRHPVSRGGSNDVSNLALACAPCNQRKASKTVSEWMCMLYEEGGIYAGSNRCKDPAS